MEFTAAFLGAAAGYLNGDNEAATILLGEQMSSSTIIGAIGYLVGAIEDCEDPDLLETLILDDIDVCHQLAATAMFCAAKEFLAGDESRIEGHAATISASNPAAVIAAVLGGTVRQQALQMGMNPQMWAQELCAAAAHVANETR